VLSCIFAKVYSFLKRRGIYLMNESIRIDPAKAKVEKLFTAITRIDWEISTTTAREDRSSKSKGRRVIYCNHVY
jgi:hypothetical protein